VIDAVQRPATSPAALRRSCAPRDLPRSMLLAGGLSAWREAGLPLKA